MIDSGCEGVIQRLQFVSLSTKVHVLSNIPGLGLWKCKARQNEVYAFLVTLTSSHVSSFVVFIEPSFLSSLRADPLLHHLASTHRMRSGLRLLALSFDNKTKNAPVDAEAVV